jgi:hypothetical protein
MTTQGSFTPHEDMNKSRVEWWRERYPGMCPYCRSAFGPSSNFPWHWKHEPCGEVREPVSVYDLANAITMCETCGECYPLGGRHDCSGHWNEDDGWDDG